MGLDPAVARVRLGVRRSLAGLAPGDLVLAACSGGADSLALAAALAFEAPRLGLRGGGVTVDHGLQAGSAEQARRVTAVLAGLGLEPVRAVQVSPSGPGGPEAAARTARYLALSEAADQLGAAAILLGHTLDDQAETVLLGLARGSGARSLAGMPARHGRYLRPLLAVRRAQTEVCRPWPTRSAPASPRHSRAPPPSFAPTLTCWTRWPGRSRCGCEMATARSMPMASLAFPPRSGRACCMPPRWRQAAPRAR